MTWDKVVGITLPSGWTISSRRSPEPGDTGGNFSVPFIVERGGRRAFMKAFDLEKLFKAHASNLNQMQHELESINFETKLLELCQKAETKNVVVPIEIGNVEVQGVNADQPIQYIIFDLGEQDVRRYHTYRNDVDYITNLIILRYVAIGLSELHSLEIAHQDLKPSNVVMFGDKSSKIADLGRSSHRPTRVWHDQLWFAGDKTYAPIEVNYNAAYPDWCVRRLGADLYMLGSLVMFLFTSVSLTTQIFVILHPDFHPGKWSDSYEAVTPYIRDALRKVLDAQPGFKKGTGFEVQNIIRELCDPDPTKRGSPRIAYIPARYSLRRYISMFERMLSEVRARGPIS
jgi:eukaryotic-like serine/threonine-protein kinase